ncbi:PREDICTED: probable 4-coumarate--CoA ligase 1 [Priapulus caudatus]|uniref:Probable 4-coumarate--CoA ligase 1 n=1 Tax=Priapulus caudatus TaxID=37621 RepID=A0ABM1E9V1_PRICU|nr:PREDICTED: probable 4-coumarate--CoA ligase 1 [Priapulus caudatus]
MEDDGSCFCAPVRSNCREHTAVLLYSSGTTGLPKGVMLTTFNLIAAMEVMNATTDALTRQMREPPSQTELGLLPFYHASGFTATLLNSMTMGSTLVILSRFQPEVFLETIQNYKINRIS